MFFNVSAWSVNERSPLADCSGVTGLDAVTVTASASEATSRVTGPVDSLSFAFTTRFVRSAVLKPVSMTWSV